MPAPTNDNFANSDTLVGDSGSVSGTTFDATKEASEPSDIAGGSSAQSVWWDFTPSTTGWYKFWIHDADYTYHGVFGFDDANYVIEVFPDGALSAMTLANKLVDGSHDSGNKFEAECAVFLTGGTQYFVRVASGKASGTVTNSYTADFTLHWGPVSPPANDNLANAISLGSVPATRTGDTTYDALMEAGEVFASTLGGTGLSKEQSVWYTFTPSVTGKYHFKVDNAVARGDHQVQTIFQISTQSTLAGYTPANEMGRFNCGTGGAGNGYFDLTSGTTYYIRISSAYDDKSSAYSFNGNTIDYDIHVRLTSAPANDNIGSATTLSTTLPGQLTNQSAYDSTPDASQPTSFPFAAGDQTIWYKFTPTVTGKYKFQVPHSSLVYEGDGIAGGSLFTMCLWHGTVIGDIISANQVGSTAFAQYSVVQDAIIVATLTAGETYTLGIIHDGTPFNNDSLRFTLEWDFIAPPANDDFANATAITGASGSQGFTWTPGATVETNEPNPYYWYSPGFPNEQGTVWFDWLCPATGDYVFQVETTDITTDPIWYEMAVWTGSAINTLTKVTRGYGGTEPESTSDRAIKTAVGFHGIAGTHYKIQISTGPDTHGPSLLTWRTNTVVGDTAATAQTPLPNGRVDNYGHTNTDPPPDFATLLSAHDYWWFTTGATGAVRWWKRTFATAGSITLNAKLWNGSRTSGNSWSIPDAGLIVYKGADYASLAVAQSEGENMAMMATNVEYLDGDYRMASFANVEMTRETYTIPVSAGETVWIALFGLYDADYTGSDEFDAPQFDVDINLIIPAPSNDNAIGLPVSYAHDLDRSEWGNYWAYAQAGQRAGTTVGASAEASEPDNVPTLVPTRSVWYRFSCLQTSLTPYKFWVESAVDCVMSIYRAPFTPINFANFVHLASDDDSGPGDQPEITLDLINLYEYWIKVDSKTEGEFTLKFQRQVPGTPPANDDFANAEVVSSVPFSASGTTVGATAETLEREAEVMGVGPTDSVWYKYVATFDGQINVSAECTSDNYDAMVFLDVWRGTTLAGLVRATDPPRLNQGYFGFGDTPQERINRAITVNVVNGQTYYFRVQTFSGGSEDFNIYIDNEIIYLNLQVISEEGGPYNDEATINLRLSPSFTEELHQPDAQDAATVYLKITPGVTWETHGHEYVDTATIYVDLQVLGGECFSTFSGALLGEGEAELVMATISDELSIFGTEELEWSYGVVSVEGIDC